MEKLKYISWYRHLQNIFVLSTLIMIPNELLKKVKTMKFRESEALEKYQKIKHKKLGHDQI